MRIVPALGLLLALGACALPQERSRTFSPYQPLQAYITGTSSSGPLFHVNRPAYVAMFYIAPGSGVSMLYPGFGRGSLSGRVFAGTHFASTRLSNEHQFLFMRGTLGMPRYLFLIASDRPLDVEQFGRFGDGLVSRLGTHFTSFSAHSTMEELTRLALPTIPNDGSWTTDFYVIWPSVIFDEPGAGRVLVTCGNYGMYVPRGYVQVVRSVICDPQKDGRAEQPEKPEEGKKPVRQPSAREPLPSQPEREASGSRAITAEQREAIRQRVNASTQLAAPRVRPELGARPTSFGRLPADERPRPGSAGGWSSGASSGSSSASPSRPAAPAARAPVREAPSSASPSSSAGSRGPVAAPATRSGDGGSGGGGSSSSGGTSPTPRAD